MLGAIETFKRNVKDRPTSWSSYDRLADAYEQSGDKKSAIENYQKALKLFNDDDVDLRRRIEDSVKKLSEGK